MSRLLNVRETAKLLGVSEATVRNWTNAGILRAQRLPRSGFRRFEQRQVEDLRDEILGADGIKSSRSRGRRSEICTVDDLRRRRDEILAIAGRSGAYNVRVFGSVARGTARPDSDVDFVVDMEPQHLGIDFFGLRLERKVDLVIANDAASDTVRRIAAEAIPL
jgi:excisionase family DNA binding protein